MTEYQVIFDPVLGRARAEVAGVKEIVGGGGGSTTVVSGGGVSPASPIYLYQDYEKTVTYVYVGYEASSSEWFIYRRTISSNTREYATGSSDYATHWTNRASETYS